MDDSLHVEEYTFWRGENSLPKFLVTGAKIVFPKESTNMNFSLFFPLEQPIKRGSFMKLPPGWDQNLIKQNNTIDFVAMFLDAEYTNNILPGQYEG